MKLSQTRIINTLLGTYHRAVETKDFIFFVNFEESDENGAVKMFDRNRKLISDNYFASEALFEVIQKDRYLKKDKKAWMSKKMKENLALSK